MEKMWSGRFLKELDSFADDDEDITDELNDGGSVRLLPIEDTEEAPNEE